MVFLFAIYCLIQFLTPIPYKSSIIKPIFIK